MDPAGKSGVGKSSLVNSLLGEKAAAVSAFKLQPDTESSSTFLRQVGAGTGSQHVLSLSYITTHCANCMLFKEQPYQLICAAASWDFQHGLPGFHSML